MINVDFSRKQTEIMRGVGIILIMMHNLMHSFSPVLKESEFYFDPWLIGRFFNILSDGSPTIVYDVISFLGWYGVPVFVFLSGYGLVRKYEYPQNGKRINFQKGESIKVREFLKRNWLKLFRLMFFGVLFFLCEELINCWMIHRVPTIESMVGILIPLTCMNDLIQFRFETIPGVYWYFGLTFELYILYAWIVNGKRPIWLWLLTALTFFSFIAVAISGGGSSVKIEEFLRHNFTGWMLPFALGIGIARNPRQNVLTILSFVILSLFLFLPSLKSIWTWQLTGVMAVVVIVLISVLFSYIPYWSVLWQWIGRLSAFIFVCHPIVRHFLGRYVFDIFVPGALPTATIEFTYILSTFLLAILYRFLTRKFLS